MKSDCDHVPGQDEEKREKQRRAEESRKQQAEEAKQKEKERKVNQPVVQLAACHLGLVMFQVTI